MKGEPYTVIGVLSESATTPLNADIYTVLQPSREGEGGGTNFEAIARLRNGATWQEANAEINRAWSLRTQRFEKSSLGAEVTYYSVPLQRAETDTLRPQVLALMLAAGLILLIAYANLAGWRWCVCCAIPRKWLPGWHWERRAGRFKNSSGSKPCCWHLWAEQSVSG